MRDVCVKVGKELASDLYQELFLILCEKDDKWIEDKYASGYWEGFIIRIVMNQFYGKYTNFAKNYINPIGYVDAIRLAAYNLEIGFKSKRENINGLQLADLAAYPIARYVIEPLRANPAFELIEPKIYAKGGKQYGLKKFP